MTRTVGALGAKTRAKNSLTGDIIKEADEDELTGTDETNVEASIVEREGTEQEQDEDIRGLLRKLSNHFTTQVRDIRSRLALLELRPTGVPPDSVTLSAASHKIPQPAGLPDLRTGPW